MAAGAGECAKVLVVNAESRVECCSQIDNSVFSMANGKADRVVYYIMDTQVNVCSRLSSRVCRDVLRPFLRLSFAAGQAIKSTASVTGRA